MNSFCKNRHHRAILSLVLALGSATAATAATSYNILDLGPGLSPAAINKQGDVVGAGAVGGQTHALLYSSGTVTDLGVLPSGISSHATGINASGEIVGFTEYSDGSRHAFQYESGSMSDLGTLPGFTGAQASAINDSGNVVGITFRTPGTPHGFLSSGGTLSDLGTFPGAFPNDTLEPHAISGNGHVTGWAQAPVGGAPHAFIINGGGIVDLGILPGHQVSYGMGINNNDSVVGTSVGANNIIDAFYYSGGTMQNLGALLPAGSLSQGFGINDSGDAVGEVFGASSYAFRYSGGSVENLNDLVDPGAGWDLTSAEAINDSGQIIGFGIFGGVSHAYRLDPISPTAPSVPEGANSAYLLLIAFGALLPFTRIRSAAPRNR